MKDFQEEYKAPILVRCQACSATMNGTFPPIPLGDSYPATLIENQITPVGSQRITLDIYFCEAHYNKFVLKQA